MLSAGLESTLTGAADGGQIVRCRYAEPDIRLLLNTSNQVVQCSPGAVREQSLNTMCSLIIYIKAYCTLARFNRRVQLRVSSGTDKKKGVAGYHGGLKCD